MVTSASQEPQHGVQSPPGESGCVYIVFIQASIMQVAWLVSRWKLHCTTWSLSGTIEWNVKEGSGHWTNGTDCRVLPLLGHSGQSHFPWRRAAAAGRSDARGMMVGCIVELDWGYLSLNHLEYHWYWWLLYWILQVSGYLSILKHGEIDIIISGTINGS